MKCHTNLRVLSCVCVLALLLAGASVPASAATKSELESKISKLEAREKEIKSELAAAKADLSASQQRKKLLDEQIDNVTEQIDLLSGRISSLSSKISAANEEIAAADEQIAAEEAEMQDTENKLRQRLRAIMKSGNVTVLQMLLNTENYTDYLIKSKAMRCIAEKDQQAIDELETQLAALHDKRDTVQEKKDALEDDKTELQKLKKSSDAKKKDLDKLCAAAQTEVRKLQSDVSEYKSDLSDTKKELEKANKAIAELIKQSSSKGVYDGSLMYWPVPTVRALSDVFGPRWGTIHRGIDIANGPIRIYGENIVAAADGEVIAVNYTSTWGSGWSSGYGYCCLIDHGKDSKGRTVTTMYAHCSVMYARVGDKVVGGKTVIAKAGKTGNVTGPHLHFEVRLDGKAVDPLYTYVDPKKN